VDTILSVAGQNRWRIGAAIKTSNSSAVYSAWKIEEKSKKNRELVVKLKPRSNGPLFQEMHFYLKVGKPKELEAFQKIHGLDGLAMPRLVGHGSHGIDGAKYRFLVFEKYGQDLKKIQDELKKFPEATINRIAVKILWCLEYIHQFGYVHGDLRAANILQDPEDPGQVRLLGLGRVKKASNNAGDKILGVLKFSSRDGHRGIPTKRGDLESLAYNMVYWKLGSLPWDKLEDPVEIEESKEKFLSNLQDAQLPESTKKILEIIRGLKREDTPNYQQLRDILMDPGTPDSGPLEFSDAAPIPADANINKKRRASQAASVSPGSSPMTLRPRASKEKIEPNPKKSKLEK
jgi:vaccinia related kinase